MQTEPLNQIQQVIDMLEQDIMHADYREVSRITGVPLGLYQRIFTYICDISVTGYVRKRKLTLAAEELLAGKKNVTEAAMECGYDSSSSFSRAFKEQFLVSPGMITEDIYKKNAFRPISFLDKDTYYVLKGRKVMADIIKIEYEDTEDMLLIGISSRDYGVSTKDLWQVFWEGGFDKKLYELKENFVGMDDCIGLGYMTDFADDTGLGGTYIIGKYFKMGTPVPEGMASRVMKGGTMVKAQVSGKDLDEIIGDSYILISNMIRKNGYTLLYDDFYWVEFYTVSRFCEPLEKGAERVILDWNMPCMKMEM